MDESKLFENLCEEMVVQILARLPTTAAVAFQVVCKRWFSLISSPYFISRFRHHHNHTDNVESSLVFRCHSQYQIISNSCLLREVYGRQSVFRLSYLPTHLQLEASFADLILCSRLSFFTNKINYYVSNPLTRQWIALPPAAYEGFAQYFSIGFLCVEDTCHHNKFMVVRLYTGHFNTACTPSSQFKAQVFSSEKWLWRTLVVSSPLTLKHYRGRTLLVAYRGMLHWLTGDCIVVYDPLNTPERFSRVIALPNQIFPFSIYGRNNWFGVSQGCLRIAKVSDKWTIDPILDVWELEDYESGWWILVHKVHLRNMIHNGLVESLQSELRCFSSVLSLHPKNGNVIYLSLYNGVVLVNMKSRIIERFYPKNERAMLCWKDAFHLVDQPWPTAVSLLH